jgi:protein O-mannosyl-transferase
LGGFGLIWSTHFQSSFHLDDFHTIVRNEGTRNLTGSSQFFTNPRRFSSRYAFAEYQPLLSLMFAANNAISKRPEPTLFQIENFLWFLIELGLIYGFLRLIPNVSREMALFATAVVGVHPVAAQTLNYALQMGVICSAVGVLAALWLWIVVPHRMPPEFLIRTPRVPTNAIDLRRIRSRPHIARYYKAFIKFNFPWYLLPLLFALLAGPAGISFLPLLALYIIFYAPDRGLKSLIPPAILCVPLWAFQCYTVAKYSGSDRIPALRYYWTQPWEVLHYFRSFFEPLHLGAVSSLEPFRGPWAPQALAGFAGLGMLIAAAVIASRRAEWRTVAFGLGWFLIALLPGAVFPQREPDAYPQMFLAMVGLALAFASAVAMMLRPIAERAGEVSARFAGLAIALVVLAALGYRTYTGARLWESDESLWSDIADNHPANGKALMNYGMLLTSAGAQDLYRARFLIGYDYLVKAATLRPGDPKVETALALADVDVGRDETAEQHFKKAISLTPFYAPAFAGYAEWMRLHSRNDEAIQQARKAISIDPLNLEARRSLAGVYIGKYQWKSALEEANKALELDSEDSDSLRLQAVASSGMDAFRNAEKTALAEPTVDHYLALSQQNYEAQRYEASIAASKAALKLQPDLVEAYSNLSAAYHALGKTDESIAALREGIRLRPDLAFLKTNLAFELAHSTKSAAH